MRIYISADMEGITGLVDAGDVQPGGADYERGRVMMTEDVNAAVRGAVADGVRQLRDLTASKLVAGNGHAKVLPGR